MKKNNSFEVEKIIQLRIDRGNRRQRQYLTKWKEYSPSKNTWEPARNF